MRLETSASEIIGAKPFTTSYEFILNGPMPPSVWQATHLLARIGATSFEYEILAKLPACLRAAKSILVPLTFASVIEGDWPEIKASTAAETLALSFLFCANEASIGP